MTLSPDDAGCRRFFENTRLAYVGALDPEGRVTLCSNAPLARGGLRLEDVLGQPFWETAWFVENDESRQTMRDLVARAQEGETAEAETTYRTADGDWAMVRAFAEPIFDGEGRLQEILVSGMDDTARLQAEQQTSLILREADHRMKNILTMIGAVARLTARSSNTMEAFLHALDLRLMAIAATHDLTRPVPGESTDLGALVRQQLTPFVDLDGVRVRTKGPEIRLAASQAQSLGLVLHEFATNAAKYGALSTPSGQVEVSWRQRGPERAHIAWEESGGPVVAEPTRSGFGTSFVSALLTPLTDGRPPRLEFRPEGFRAEIDIVTGDLPQGPAPEPRAIGAAAR